MIKKTETLIMDGQVFQTTAWHRGMGKYSYSLISALLELGIKEHYKKIEILLNTNLEADPQSIKDLQQLKNVQIRYVDLATPEHNTKIERLQIENKYRLEKALADVEGAFDFLILSLFIDETCIVFPDRANQKQIIFYDLIPLLYHERYSQRINFSGYLDHFKTIFEADKVFTISQTVANDLGVFLGLDAGKLVNIDGASIDRSRLPSKKPEIDIGHKYILMPSGDEIRKNNLRAVRGFEEFNSLNGDKYKLVLTSYFSEHTIAELQTYSSNLVFTGNIPEDELQWLYLNADLLLFASEYEGLGLPVLEAINVGQKVACSDIPVFKEISAGSLYFFDHMDPSSIARTIAKALASDDWSEKQKGYALAVDKYSWANTADKFIKSITTQKMNAKFDPKKKIAVLTPHPAGFSAIGKVVAECHDAFSKHFDIDYYYDYGVYHRAVRPNYLSHIATAFDAAEFNAKRYAEYDAVIYHIGNSDYHLDSIKAALHLPGYVILHDTFLNGAFESMQRAGYITKARLELEEELNQLDNSGLSEYLTSICNNQLGIITHSDYASRAVRNVLEKAVHVEKVNLPVATPSRTDVSTPKHLQIGLAGIIADVKGLSIIEELASSDLYKDCVINIFGFNFAKPHVTEQFKKWSHVKIHSNPTDFEFQTKLSSLDVLINYRMEYRGETSLTALEAMRYGVVVVVRGDVGWYSELPDGTVLKATTVDQVISCVESVMQDTELYERVSHAAREYTSQDHSHQSYVQGVVNILDMKKDKDLFATVKAIRHSSSQKSIEKTISIEPLYQAKTHRQRSS